MPTVELVVPTPAVRGGRQRAAAIAGVGGTVTLDVTNPEVDLDGLAARWEEVDRPGDRPYLAKTGKRLRTIQLEAVIGLDGADRERDVTGDLNTLEHLADPIRDDDVVVLSFSRLERATWLTHTGTWVITDLRYRIRRRRPSDHAPTSARVDVTLTEASPLSGKVNAPGSASSPSATATGSGSTVPAGQTVTATSPTTSTSGSSSSTTSTSSSARRHTIAAGDTLWTLAARYYGGDTSQWRAIAEANRIDDPRTLQPGRVLTLP